jgi:stage V sporulation protein B
MSSRPETQDRAVEAGRGALFIGFAKAFFMLSGFLQRWLLTHFVGPAEYGAFSLVNGVVSTVNNTIVQGTIQWVSKFTAEDDARAEAVKRAGLIQQAFVGGGVALAFLLAAPLIARFENAPGYVPWFRMVAAIPLLYAFYSVFVGSANGQRRFRLQASFDVGFSTAKTILLLLGAVIGRGIGHSVAGAFLGFIAAAAIILVVSATVVGPPRGPERFPARRLFVFTVGVAAYTLLINLALNYDLMLLRKFAGAVVLSRVDALASDYEALRAVALLRADALAGNYEALRNIALLPYQALLVLTFVVFPLVSRSTFSEDRDATRLYITQTLRYALMIAAAMAVVLAARPLAILGILYKPAYAEGASALPVLAAAVCGLALLSVSGSIINASGRPAVAAGLVAATVAAGGVAAWVLVPRAAPGPEMLLASALANGTGVALGLALALIYLRRRFGAGPPLLTVLRVALAAAAAVGVGRLIPGTGKLAGLVALAAVGVVFLAALLVLRELGPADTAKLRKILRRR